MTDRRPELLRPEDATSWEEFQARWVIERAGHRVAGRSWRDTGRILLAVILGIAAVVFWVGVALAGPAERWVLLVLALGCTALFGWDVGGVLRRRWRAARRRAELDRLRGEWQARAERGEIPQATPGGPKVWRDEIHVEVPPDKQASLPKYPHGPDCRNGSDRGLRFNLWPNNPYATSAMSQTRQ